MVVSFVDLALIVIVLFGVFSLFRGVRSVALTTAAIFFAVVVVLLPSAGLVIAAFQRLGVPLDTVDTQALFTIGLFVFTAYMASRVLGVLVAVPTGAATRREKLWGFLLGLLNGFIIMALIEHYLAVATQATAGSVSVGVPALVFSHPTASTWSVILQSTPLTLLPPAPTSDLWAKLPVALVLLLLFLAFVFVGTIYGRVSRSRG